MKSYPGLGKWAGERVTVEGFVEENRIDRLYQGAYAVTIGSVVHGIERAAVSCEIVWKVCNCLICRASCRGHRAFKDGNSDGERQMGRRHSVLR